MALHFHLRYPDMMTNKRAVNISLSLWFLACTTSCIRLWNVTYAKLVMARKYFPASRGLSRRGKNERKERDSLLSLIFASSRETSASREVNISFRLKFKNSPPCKLWLSIINRTWRDTYTRLFRLDCYICQHFYILHLYDSVLFSDVYITVTFRH